MDKVDIKTEKVSSPPSGSISGDVRPVEPSLHTSPPGGLASTASAAPQLIERQPKQKPVLHCPYPGCNRTFQSGIWRLRVHYRAPPTARGSGVERGHGTELVECPQCKSPVSGASLRDLCECFFRPAGAGQPLAAAPPDDQTAVQMKETTRELRYDPSLAHLYGGRSTKVSSWPVEFIYSIALSRARAAS